MHSSITNQEITPTESNELQAYTAVVNGLPPANVEADLAGEFTINGQ